MMQRFSKVLFRTSVTVLAVGALASCAPKQSTTTGTDSTGSVAASVEHGKYLVKTTGCGDCHTPWVMGPQGPMQDTTKMLSGHPAGLVIPGPIQLGPPWMGAIDMSFTAFSGPWGVSFSANLTPDSATGLGAWSQETFMQALRTGKHMGQGRPIMPPMPWPAFSNMTDNDLASIFMYLHSIPAVSNKVPDAIVNSAMAGGAPPPPPPPGSGAMAPPPPTMPPHPTHPPTAAEGRPPMPSNAPKPNR